MPATAALGLLVGSAILGLSEQRQAEKRQERAAKEAAEAQERALQAQLDSQKDLITQQQKARAAAQAPVDPTQGGGKAIIGADAVSALTGQEPLRASRTRVASSVGGLGRGSGVQV